MKLRICIFVSLISLLALITACDLEEHPYSSISTKDFYKNKQETNLALNGVYQSLKIATLYSDRQWENLNDITGETLQHYPKKDNFDLFTWQGESDMSNVWTDCYDGINRANSFLDNLSKTDLSSGTKKKFRGQAKFLRAFLYFNLVRLFGGVPIYTEGTTNLNEVNRPRSSSAEVYKQIENDLKNAAKDLSPFNANDHQAGRVTSGAAKSILAKVYIQQNKWEKAKNMAKEVIDMGEYGLFRDYEAIMAPEFSNGKEQIFSIQYSENSDQIHLRQRFGPPPTTLPSGNNVVFQRNTEFSQIWQVSPEFFKNTPNTYRKWQTMRKKMPYYIKGETVVQDTIQLEQPFMIKLLQIDQLQGIRKPGVNYVVIRYSDVLLMYAEALNELNSSPPQVAYEAINKVRSRARAVGTSHEQPERVYPDLSGLTKAEFRDSVLTEEGRELIGEGHRRTQLLRHNRFLQNAPEGAPSKSKHLRIYPIPPEEIARNPNLEQNPGY